MKNRTNYETNKAGVIKSGKKPANEPKAEKIEGDDLRRGKGSNGKK